MKLRAADTNQPMYMHPGGSNGNPFASETAPTSEERTPRNVPGEVLLDEICDSLEAIANLVYLLEQDAGERDKVVACARSLTGEVSRVIRAAHGHLHHDAYAQLDA